MRREKNTWNNALRDDGEPIYRINLTRKSDLSDLNVDMESFFDFSFWIAKELANLVDNFEKKDGRSESPKN